MAGDIDVYQLCPCGSGKKLKFCCQAIVSEMIKVSELQQSHQFQAALTLLDSVEKKVQPRDVWSRAWVKTTKAFILFSLGSVEEPRQIVREVLGELPEHPLAVAVNGVLALAADGYPAAMRPVYRAFQIASADQPHLTSHLAMALAQVMMAKGHFLATRQYLNLAVRCDPENEDAVKAFLEFVRDVRLPWPLRDGYALAPLAGSENLKPQFEQAVKLAFQGCFSDAAKAFGQIARQDQKQPGVWWNIALCHAWAGEDPLAVEAFKAAAANQPDFESAVDCVVLSHQLRQPGARAKAPQLTGTYRTESVSRLLTALDQKPEYARLELPPPDPNEDEHTPTAIYRILDRDPGLVPADSLSPQNIAHVLGELIVFDRHGEEPAKAFVSAYERERFDKITASFVAIAGELATAEGEPEEQGFLRKEHVPLIQDWYFPPSLSAAQMNDLRRASTKHVVEEVWPTVPQVALGGKTPSEATKAPELKMALAAASVDLDVFCEKNNLVVDENAVRTRLGLPAVTPTPVSTESGGELVSVLRLRHTALGELSDEALMRAADNVMRIGHSNLSCAAVKELLGRASLQARIDTPRMCMFLSRAYGRRLDFDAALEWVVRGKDECRNRKQALDALALWEVHELMLRSQRPDDPKIVELANSLWNYYLPKLPEIREVVMGVLNELSIPGPWNAAAAPVGATEPLAAAGVGSSSLWTPEAQTAGQPSKLWLPGQE